MNGKKWIRTWFIIIVIIPILGVFNYVVDPYGLYDSNLVNKPKITQNEKIRLVNAIKIKELKPIAVVMGTSRADSGYNPDHSFFLKPSYNVAVGGGTMYENRLYLEELIKNGNLKQVLLVLDYRMLNGMHKKEVSDFETYFDVNKYIFLFAGNTAFDSLRTLIGGTSDCLYKKNGQRVDNWGQTHCDSKGGHSNYFNSQNNYYEKYPSNYTYKYTNESTFQDFEKFVIDCYKNNVKLDIIFGPSHIRQWENLDYYIGFDKWLKWKKDIILSINKIANEYNKKQFRIMDFAVYHPLTAEKIPTDKNTKMKYHWESSHYKNELGLIVLDRLIGDSKYKDFGLELNLSNIDNHLKQQRIKRKQYIDTKQYQLEVWGKVKD